MIVKKESGCERDRDNVRVAEFNSNKYGTIFRQG